MQFKLFIPYQFKYLQCERLASGGYREHTFCCPAGLYWNQESLTCTHEHDGKYECYDDYDCAEGNSTDGKLIA
jgi:hypothetical protein